MLHDMLSPESLENTNPKEREILLYIALRTDIYSMIQTRQQRVISTHSYIKMTKDENCYIEKS